MPKSELKEFAILYKLKSEKKKLKSEAPEHEIIVKAANLTAAKKKAKNDKRVITDGWELAKAEPLNLNHDTDADESDDFTAPDFEPCGDYDEDEYGEDEYDEEDHSAASSESENEEPTAEAETPAPQTEMTQANPETPEQRIAALRKHVDYIDILLREKENMTDIHERRLEVAQAQMDLVDEAKNALDTLDATDIVESLSREDEDYGSETKQPEGFIDILDTLQDRIVRHNSQDELDAFNAILNDEEDARHILHDVNADLDNVDADLKALNAVRNELFAMIEEVEDEVYEQEAAAEEAHRAMGLVETESPNALDYNYSDAELCGEVPSSIYDDEAEGPSCSCFACFFKNNAYAIILTFGLGALLGFLAGKI